MKYLINSETAIKDIADAIREKTGTENTITVNEMPELISNIETGSTSEDYPVTMTITSDFDHIRGLDYDSNFGLYWVSNVYHTVIVKSTDSSQNSKYKEITYNHSIGNKVEVIFSQGENNSEILSMSVSQVVNMPTSASMKFFVTESEYITISGPFIEGVACCNFDIGYKYMPVLILDNITTWTSSS